MIGLGVVKRRLTGFVLTMAGLLMLSSAMARAQTAGFEVASVRLSPPGGDGYTVLGPYGEATFTARNMPLPFLLQIAFGVEAYQLGTLPSWTDSVKYDISAKPEGDARLTHDQLMAPLQQLLIQRLHLTFHRETKDFKGYALVVAKGGSKLKLNVGEARHAFIFSNKLEATKINMPAFAAMMAMSVKKPVADKTGLLGEFDFRLSFAPVEDVDSELPSIFTALQEQLGLRLEAQPVPVQVLVIDHVDRVPTEN